MHSNAIIASCGWLDIKCWHHISPRVSVWCCASAIIHMVAVRNFQYLKPWQINQLQATNHQHQAQWNENLVGEVNHGWQALSTVPCANQWPLRCIEPLTADTPSPPGNVTLFPDSPLTPWPCSLLTPIGHMTINNTKRPSISNMDYVSMVHGQQVIPQPIRTSTNLLHFVCQVTCFRYIMDHTQYWSLSRQDNNFIDLITKKFTCLPQGIRTKI